jgi:hypothetical protein
MWQPPALGRHSPDSLGASNGDLHEPASAAAASSSTNMYNSDPAFSEDPHMHPDFGHDDPPYTPDQSLLDETDEQASSSLDTQLSQYLSSISMSTHTSTSLATTIEEEEEGEEDEEDDGLAYLDQRLEVTAAADLVVERTPSPQPPPDLPPQRPELHMTKTAPEPRAFYPPPTITQPGRPSSTPPALTSESAARTLSKPRSSSRSALADLDCIDELDESDPFGLNHHQSGRYEQAPAHPAHPIRPAVGGPSWKAPTPVSRTQSCLRYCWLISCTQSRKPSQRVSLVHTPKTTGA